jgi:hypothetical protein
MKPVLQLSQGRRRSLLELVQQSTCISRSEDGRPSGRTSGPQVTGLPVLLTVTVDGTLRDLKAFGNFTTGQPIDEDSMYDALA